MDNGTSKTWNGLGHDQIESNFLISCNNDDDDYNGKKQRAHEIYCKKNQETTYTMEPQISPQLTALLKVF